jgi:hypothetical protein
MYIPEFITETAYNYTSQSTCKIYTQIKKNPHNLDQCHHGHEKIQMKRIATDHKLLLKMMSAAKNKINRGIIIEYHVQR